MDAKINKKQKEKKEQKEEQGQSLIEMIVFIPLLISLMFLFHTVINSLNNAINQQKIVRGYYYRFLRHNSYILSSSDVQEYIQKRQMRSVGMYVIGHREKSLGEERDSASIAACQEIKTLSKNKESTTCDEPSKMNNSLFIKIFTVYGLCTTPFVLLQENFFSYKSSFVGRNSCSLVQ